jgi:soluble lytic murein transglycosylase
VKVFRYPALLLLASLVGGSGHAQQGGVTVLRGEGANPPSAVDTGVHRLPSAGSGAARAARGAPPKTAEIPIASESGGAGVLPSVPTNDLAQAITSGKALTAAEAAALGAAFKAIDEGRYADARPAVANFGNPLLSEIVDWSVLRAAPKADADFASTWRFLREHPDWPEPEVLRRQAEERITADTPPGDVWAYLTAFPPLTSIGHLRRLEAASAVSPKDVPRLASESWRTATFKSADEDEFLNRYGQYLSGDDHIARFDRILREGRSQVARDLLAKLPPDYQPVAEARLAMATRAADAVTILRGVPAAKLNEPAIRLEQVSWLRRTGKLDEARALLAAPSGDQGDAWSNERQQVARDLLAAGRPAEAYAVANQHGQVKGVAFAEAEFLAGWIALRHLKKPGEGLKHFQTLYDGVSTDVSKSRAAYWLGRAYEASGRPKDARSWYTRAAEFGQTFYGQLAARKLPGGASRLPTDPVASESDLQALSGQELVTVARYIGQSGHSERTRPFLLRLARVVKGPGETLLLAHLAVELKRPDVALTIARHATQTGVTLFNASFPVVDLGPTGSIERALALAVTRQESAFNSAAVSPSGALGLMQLMPGTARDVAGRLGLPFVQSKLTADPTYNVALGSQYLAEMLQRFGGSYELALAAYNAGPNRVARWLQTIGDPRGGKIDMIDWIEMIPLRETRNYVERIMESVGVYRDRLSGPFRMLSPAMGRS